MYRKTFEANVANRLEESLEEIPFVQLTRLKRAVERFLREIDKAIINKDRQTKTDKRWN